MYAFVYRSGVIGIAPRMPRLGTVLPLLKGPRRVLQGAIEACAQEGGQRRVWLVPGVAGVVDDAEARAAVELFRAKLEAMAPNDTISRYVLVQEAA